MILPKEKQVCALEYAQKFKELGVKQESLFKWFDVSFPNKANEIHLNTGSKINCTRDFIDFDSCAAFTVAELGELIINTSLFGYADKSVEVGKWFIGVCVDEEIHEEEDENEANARAKLLIWLIENGHIKGDEL